jgi:Na+:H+ antiporter, NhaA family
LKDFVSRKVIDPLTDFIDDEVLGGAVLFVAALAALAWANSPWSESYFSLWTTHLEIGSGSFNIDLDLQHWINDLLMAVFFFVVGAEIKRELVSGELKDRRDAMLPVLAAFGGVALPAILFLTIVGGGEAASGWAIPAATDIAFAIGVLALLGKRISPGVRIFLLTVAIVDDIVAIAIIAFFYGSGISLTRLVIAVAGLLGVFVFQRLGIWRVWPYVPLAGIVWLATFESGIHATVAGVALGLMVPVRPFHGHEINRKLEHAIHPVSAFFVIPVFALANAGIDLGGGVLGDAFTSEIAWGVIAGLVVGKILGISGTTLAALKLGLGSLPNGMRPAQVWGVAALAGIGFTVSLFTTDLAFENQFLTDSAKVGIFTASILSGIIGSTLLMRTRGYRSDEPRNKEGSGR